MYDTSCDHNGHYCQCDPRERPRKPRKVRRRASQDGGEGRMLAGMARGNAGLRDYVMVRGTLTPTVGKGSPSLRRSAARFDGDRRVILPARAIPLDATVTKYGGSVPYTLRRELTLYEASGARRTLAAGEGTLLLVSASGDANAISLDQDLVWETSVDVLRDWFELEAECQ